MDIAIKSKQYQYGTFFVLIASLLFCYQPSHAQLLNVEIPPLNPSQVLSMKRLLDIPDHELDYLDTKLVIDQQIAPFSFSGNKVRVQVAQMVEAIESMLSFAASQTDKLLAVQRYLYEAGEWNDHTPFQYDFTDPLGTQNPKGPLLHNYLTTRKGNCVSMPILFLILADRLGLDVTLTNAPKHLLVYFVESDTKKQILIETTSGGNPTRAGWIAKQFHITPTAKKSGIYLHKLNKRQSIASMTHSLAADLYKKEHYFTVIELTELHRKYNPKSIDAILTRGASYGWLADKLYRNKYKKFQMIPPEKQGHADYVSRQSAEAVIYARSLGWKQETPKQQKEYLNKLGSAALGYYN